MGSCSHSSKYTNRWTEPAGTKIVDDNGQKRIVNFCIDCTQESCQNPECGWVGPTNRSAPREC